MNATVFILALAALAYALRGVIVLRAEGDGGSGGGSGDSGYGVDIEDDLPF